MGKRLAAAAVVWILVTGMGVSAAATEIGRIRVKLDGVTAEDRGAVALVQVAEPVEGGFRLEEAFGGGVIRQEEACDPELAQWLAQRNASVGDSRVPDALGIAEFSALEEGLYLVVQTLAPEGWACALPFLVPLPLDGEWEVLACPKQSVILTQSPRTGQHPAPLFAAMGLVLSGMGLYLCVEKLRKK